MDVIKTHTIVIGAGVIGLSIAREIAAKGHEVIILEKATRCGDGITSRNSGVIHSGLYYEKNSEKAKLCLQGKELLYQYVKDRSIPYQKCEKIIIASSEQEKQIIKNLYENGVTNGVKGLRLLTKSDVEQKMIESWNKKETLLCSTIDKQRSWYLFNDEHSYKDRLSSCVDKLI